MFKRHPFLRAIVIFIECWLIGLAVLAIMYFAYIRDWQMNWGASDEDISRVMVGDELRTDPELNATRAVIIKGSPEQIWPWLVQMGYNRGGFYAFDKLDHGGIPSADSIIPEFQNLQVGDTITFLQVVEMVPNESMLWVFLPHLGGWGGGTWSWGLYPIDDQHTKLVSRLRQNYTYDSIQEIIMWSMMDALEIVMMRTSMLGIKHRVEGG
ncbi:MAG: hypothetical protein GY839_05100 [candidate division Zixibacteria bacterium]|nr:hypothetical protein [candidate division Zixibacteria bacterium]